MFSAFSSRPLWKFFFYVTCVRMYIAYVSTAVKYRIPICITLTFIRITTNAIRLGVFRVENRSVKSTRRVCENIHSTRYSIMCTYILTRVDVFFLIRILFEYTNTYSTFVHIFCLRNGFFIKVNVWWCV